MEGIGERFGSSFDDVRRDLRPAAVVLLFDLFAGFSLVAFLLAVEAWPAPVRFLPFAVPGALPTATDLVDVVGTATGAAEARGIAVAAALALVLAPVAAWLEGGMVGVLKAAYVEREPGPLGPRFEASARKHFRPLLAYRLLLHATLVAGFVAARQIPGFGDEAVGALVLEFALVFTPFVVVFEDESSWGGMKRSVSLIADHLATSLVMLLFGLLVTGGAAALAEALVRFAGAWALVPLAVVYAVVGTALATFVMKVYLSFRPDETAPAKSAPLAAPA